MRPEKVSILTFATKVEYYLSDSENYAETIYAVQLSRLSYTYRVAYV